MISGDIVIEKDGNKAVVYEVYNETECSLCINGYDTIGDMAERDSLTLISDLTVTDKNIFGKPLGLCNQCDSPIFKEKVLKGYPYYCPNCNENKYNIEVTLFSKKSKK